MEEEIVSAAEGADLDYHADEGSVEENYLGGRGWSELSHFIHISKFLWQLYPANPHKAPHQTPKPPPAHTTHT